MLRGWDAGEMFFSSPAAVLPGCFHMCTIKIAADHKTAVRGFPTASEASQHSLPWPLSASAYS